jgi:heat shock protein HslJ
MTDDQTIRNLLVQREKLAPDPNRALTEARRRHHRRQWRLPLIIAACTAVLLATVTLFVTTRHDIPTATATGDIPDLHGNWTLGSAGGPDTLAVPHPSSWTLMIGPGDQITIGLACDSITGKYRIDGTTLRLENAVDGLGVCGYSKSVPQTQIAAIQAIDRVMSSLAQGKITFTAMPQGQLRLNNSTVWAIFTKSPPPPDRGAGQRSK